MSGHWGAKVGSSKLEQHRATKLVPQIRHLPYLKRLSILGLQKLEERRIRGDVIQYYKIDKSFNAVH